MYKQVLIDIQLAIELRTQQINNAGSEIDNKRRDELYHKIEIWLEVADTINREEVLATKENLPIGVWFELYEVYGLIGKPAPAWVHMFEMDFKYDRFSFT